MSNNNYSKKEKKELKEKYKDKIINGKEIANKLKHELKRKIQKEKIYKTLAVVFVGNNKASKTYIDLKEEFAKEIGVNFCEYRINGNAKEKEVLECLDFLAKDPEIDGIIVQLPLPPGFNTKKITKRIPLTKDVDGFLKNSKFKPVLGQAILKVMDEIKEDLNNKKIALVCNSDIFGDGIRKSIIDKYNNAKCEKLIFADNSLEEIAQKTKEADIIITAVGNKHYLKANFVKEGGIIIDIGITKEKGITFGDADFFNVLPKVKYITPPVKGIGPLCVAMLFWNLIEN